jgi:hypothetical protein
MVIMNKPISIAVQELHLKKVFPNSVVKTSRNAFLTWLGVLTPSSLSIGYRIFLKYDKYKDISVYILDPKLVLAKGEKFLPHVYSTQEQKICLFYRRANEWDSSMLLTNTIIPWTSEWLYHYEIWAGTGVWNGGGYHVANYIDKNKNTALVNTGEISQRPRKRRRH